MDYVDLYQIHRWDPRTPIEETMEALHDVVRAGKARYIGASSMFSWQFAKAQHIAETHGWTKFVSMQNHYNLDLPRGGARDDPALPRPGRRGASRGARWPGAMLAGNRTRDGGRHTTRSSTDPFTDYLYDQPTDFDVVDAVARGRRRPGRARGPGGPGLAAGQAGRDGSDRRVDQAEAPQGRPGRRGSCTLTDDEIGQPREALRAPPGARSLLGRRTGSGAARGSRAPARSE